MWASSMYPGFFPAKTHKRAKVKEMITHSNWNVIVTVSLMLRYLWSFDCCKMLGLGAMC